MAATALGAVRLHPEVVDAVHKYKDGVRELGTSASGRTRAASFAGFEARGVSSQSRGKICRAPMFRTSSTPRREALLSAMSEEHDITDMQETDKVSGEWWKPILTAVHDWSQDKLLGLAELADGSLFFSFGPGSDSNSASAAKASKPKSETTKIKSSASTNNSAPQKMALPQRHPSSFRKHSPIPASRKKAVDLNEAAVESKPQKTQKAAKSKPRSKSASLPQRPPSLFSKRSPIPKNRVNSVSGSVSAPASKKKSQSAVEETAAVDAPSIDSAKDSPISPELKEILSSGNKETSEQESKGSVKSAKKSSATPASSKKKASKVSTEETVEAIAPQTSSASGSPAAKKKTPPKVSTEETVEATAPQTSSAPLVVTINKASKVPSEGEAAVEVSDPAENSGSPAAAAAAAAENNGAAAVSEDLGSYKLPELRSLAKARGLKGYSKLKKGELVDLLAGSQS